MNAINTEYYMITSTATQRPINDLNATHVVCLKMARVVVVGQRLNNVSRTTYKCDCCVYSAMSDDNSTYLDTLTLETQNIVQSLFGRDHI